MGSANTRARELLRIVALAGALAATVAVSAEPCPPGDLLRLDGVRARTAHGERILGRDFLAEGSDDATLPLVPPLDIDLGQSRTLKALMLQAGHDDLYTIEGSDDGASWTRLAVAREVEGGGLRSRAMRLSRPARVRFLRVTAQGGDGAFSISGIRAWCRVPELPPTAIGPPRLPRLRPVRAAQFGIALGGLVLFGCGVVLRRTGRPNLLRRFRDGALIVLGLLAGLAWWNFGQFHPGSGFVHTWEHLHYFLGAKYFDELGYQRLYPCITIADVEDGLQAPMSTRKVRDMTTNLAEPAAAIVADPDRCKRHFAEARWDSFRHDVRWFRARLPPVLWERVFLDHGYNAPPVWGILGTTLTRRLPAGDRAMLALSLLDPLLLLAMWGAVLWAFGWRATCVALLWWGTNRMAYFEWVGGGLLRQDWLLLSILGLCLVRRHHAFSGGLALGYAALLRIFPGLIVAALVLHVVATSLRARRIVVTRDQSRFALGCVVAFALLLPLSAATSGGVASWRAFADNVRGNTRSTGANIVGLMSVLSYENANREGAFADSELANADERRLQAKRDAFQRRRPVFWLLFAGFLLLLSRAARDESDWVTLTLGIGLIPIGVFVASYYYGILLGYGLLWRRWGDGVGVLLCALSVATHVTNWIWPAPIQWDTRFAWNSLATVIAVLGFTLMALVSRVRSDAPRGAEPAH